MGRCVSLGGRMPRRRLISPTKRAARSGISSGRSRSGVDSIRNTARRIIEVFPEPSRCGLGLKVSVGRRDDPDVGSTRSYAPSRSTRRSLLCRSSGISPTSSRKIVPRRRVRKTVPAVNRRKPHPFRRTPRHGVTTPEPSCVSRATTTCMWLVTLCMETEVTRHETHRIRRRNRVPSLRRTNRARAVSRNAPPGEGKIRIHSQSPG